ncbi:hypothetical protein [Thermofilum pendens]|uniref:Uncharacterized protein n=1 Tax=Thermofilum pendens (strain DSM 2475 / Hrk 5) TaxID=368408 RepID=A1RWC9_THEPD|nr:hypothetical protein [Thermofilum pendens]ABL77509.1 hypothetical protein Tpen_0099 [Thermofilum pendens Hrk 5]
MASLELEDLLDLALGLAEKAIYVLLASYIVAFTAALLGVGEALKLPPVAAAVYFTGALLLKVIRGVLPSLQGRGAYLFALAPSTVGLAALINALFNYAETRVELYAYAVMAVIFALKVYSEKRGYVVIMAGSP